MAQITNFYIGDTLTIEREINDIPIAQTIRNAWFTVKRKYTDPDEDAILQKILSSGESSDGAILDTGVDGTGRIRFILTPNETLLFSPLSEYLYDIQVKTSAGEIYTKEYGVIKANPQITMATE